MVAKNAPKFSSNPGIFRDANDIADARSKWDVISAFMWNPTQKAVLGRDAKSWFRVLGFYVVFYSGMFGFWAFNMFFLLHYVVDWNVPYFQQEHSRIGANPGVSFIPVPIQEDIDIFIKYNLQQHNSTELWTSKLDNFIDHYERDTAQHQKCDFNNPPAPGNTCGVNFNNLGPCTPENQYGWSNATPCIYIKLNRIYGWHPEFYDDVNSLPEDMPKDLVDHITKLPAIQRKQIWTSCKPKKPVDGNVTFSYYPSRGLPSYYFPYLNAPGYVSPFIAVMLENLTNETRTTVECRMWAKNVIYNGHRNDRQGSIIFDIMVS